MKTSLKTVIAAQGLGCCSTSILRITTVVVIDETILVGYDLHVVIVRDCIYEAVFFAKFQRTRYNIRGADGLARLIFPLDSITGALALFEFLYELIRLHRSNQNIFGYKYNQKINPNKKNAPKYAPI